MPAKPPSPSPTPSASSRARHAGADGAEAMKCRLTSSGGANQPPSGPPVDARLGPAAGRHELLPARPSGASISTRSAARVAHGRAATTRSRWSDTAAASWPAVCDRRTSSSARASTATPRSAGLEPPEHLLGRDRQLPGRRLPFFLDRLQQVRLVAVGAADPRGPGPVAVGFSRIGAAAA